MQVFKTISDMKPPFNPEIALTALINGEWDNPHLLNYGDILNVAQTKFDIEQMFMNGQMRIAN